MPRRSGPACWRTRPRPCYAPAPARDRVPTRRLPGRQTQVAREVASRRETLDVAHEGNECRRLVQASGNVRDSFVLSDPSLPLNAPVNFVVSGTLDAAVSTVGGGSIGGQADATAVIVVSGSFGSSVIGGPEAVCCGIGIHNLNLCTDCTVPNARFFVSFAEKWRSRLAELPVGGYSQSDAGRLRLRPLVLWRNRGDGRRRSHDDRQRRSYDAR